MSRLTSAQVIALGEYLEPTFDPASLTVSQLLGVLGYHNVKYPTPYSKLKLAMIFNEEIKAKSVHLKKERVKKDNSIASDDGILDGATGRPLRKEVVNRRVSRRISHAPIQDEVEVPHQPKRRRSSAQPTLGGSSRKNVVAQFPRPTLVEESEAEEDMPVKKVARNRKKVESAGAQSRRVSNSAAEDSGWEDNNIFQSGAESSSPVRPSPIRPKTARKSAPSSHKSRKSSSAPPQMLLSSPSRGPDLSDHERMSPLPPPQFKFEPALPSISPLHSKKPQSPNFTPSKRRVSIQGTGREDDAGELNTFNDDFPVSKQTKPFDENKLAALEEQNEVEGFSITDLRAVEDYTNTEFESVIQDGKHPVQRHGMYGRIAFYGFICLLMVVASSSIISYKVDSASIGYCDAGSSTNGILEQRRADRASVEACNREDSILPRSDNNTALEPNTTFCPIPSLVPWRPPDSCTRCPDHANCTTTSIFCDSGYLLRSHPLFFFVPASPSPRDTTVSVSSPVDLFWKVLSVLDGLPGLGSVAFPPRCIEDPERKRKIGFLGKAIESLLGQERGRRLCAGGKMLKEPADDSDGGDAKKWGLELENLREMMQKKTHPHLLPSFDDMFNEAIHQLIQWGGIIIGEDHANLRYVAHKTPSLTWDCVITIKSREFWIEWRPIIFGSMFAILSFVYSRTRNTQRRAENKRIADLVQIALDTLRNQEFAYHTDPVTTPQPYISSLQLRDLILQDEHSVASRTRLWDHVERVVEGNANVRANLQEIQGGDEMRVWRWVGSARRKTINAPRQMELDQKNDA